MEEKAKTKIDAKAFKIFLLIACITLGILVFLLMFCTAEIAIKTDIAILAFAVLILGTLYALPVILIIFAILGIMYLIRAGQYKGKKLHKILSTVLIFVFIVISTCITYYTFIKYGLTDRYVINISSKINNIEDGAIRSNLIERLENEEIYVEKIVLEMAFKPGETIYYIEDGKREMYSSSIDDNEYITLKEKSTDISEITRISYKVFWTTDLVLIVLLCINSIQQYNLFSENNIEKPKSHMERF